ncbi:MAG: hypothetical protein DMF53_25350, partial [Acidobacteria bacterium]
HQVFRGNREAVQRITLTGGSEGPVVLARRRGGFWMERPVADRADRDLVDGLLSDLTGLTADRFLDGPQNLAALGLNPPKGAVDVVFSDGTPPARVELGNAVTGPAAPEGQPAGELAYGKMGDTVFQVRTRLGESVRRAPIDWRALQLSLFEVHDVDSATVRDGGGVLSLTRSGTDWKRGDTLISYLPVSDLFFAVTGARAQRVLTPAEAAGLTRPLLTFELHGKELGDETLTLYPLIKDGVAPSLFSEQRGWGVRARPEGALYGGGPSPSGGLGPSGGGPSPSPSPSGGGPPSLCSILSILRCRKRSRMPPGRRLGGGAPGVPMPGPGLGRRRRPTIFRYSFSFSGPSSSRVERMLLTSARSRAMWIRDDSASRASTRWRSGVGRVTSRRISRWTSFICRRCRVDSW